MSQEPMNLCIIRVHWTFWCSHWNIPGELVQYHGCQCLGSLHHLCISNHGIAYSDRLVQERCNSSALAMELRLSCINPSIEWTHPCLPSGWILSTCIVIVLIEIIEIQIFFVHFPREIQRDKPSNAIISRSVSPQLIKAEWHIYASINYGIISLNNGNKPLSEPMMDYCFWSEISSKFK